VSRLPHEARGGLMRAWLEILKERYPEVAWVASPEEAGDEDGSDDCELSLRGGHN
jgi:hypothetical protein